MATNTYKTKIRVNLTVNKEVYEAFSKFADEKSINKSKFLENAIKKYLIENEVSFGGTNK